MIAITTHVLDTARGRPAAGLAVALERRGASGWQPVGRGVTDVEGRLRDLPPAAGAGTYRLIFATGAYFDRLGVESFYPDVTVVFEARDSAGHYHVPLLLSPYGYSTYRGT